MVRGDEHCQYNHIAETTQACNGHASYLEINGQYSKKSYHEQNQTRPKEERDFLNQSDSQEPTQAIGSEQYRDGRQLCLQALQVTTNYEPNIPAKGQEWKHLSE